MPTSARILVISIGVLLALSVVVFFAYRSRTHRAWPGKTVLIVTLVACLMIVGAGAVIVTAINQTPPGASHKTSTTAKNDSGVDGVYVVVKNLYMTPFSSALPSDSTPEVYGVTKDEFIVGNTSTGYVSTYAIDHQNTTADASEFTKEDPWSDLPSAPPGLGRSSQRHLVATIRDDDGPAFALYHLNNELWLAEFSGAELWAVFQLEPTKTTTLGDLERARQYYTSHPYDGLELGVPYPNQLTVSDVYALARKGAALTLEDLEPFAYRLTGLHFADRTYLVVGADTVTVQESNGIILSASVLSARTVNPSETVDLRKGFQAVTEYLDPLRSFDHLIIEQGQYLEGERDLLFEDDYFGSQSRYYLGNAVASTYVTYGNGERVTVAQALREHRLSVEDAHAAGLRPIYMVPIDNPLGGEFAILRGLFIMGVCRRLGR